MAITAAGERIERIEVAMEAQLGEWHMEPVARALMAMRGFSIIAAMITVSELGDIHRFEHPRQLMAYIGLVGREDSSGDKEKRGSITKAGNSHLRWILCESSQHYRLPPGVSERLSKRQSAVDKRIRKAATEIAWKAQVRLHGRWTKLASRRLTRQKIQVALARELCGFVWAVMRAATPALTPAKQTKATAAEI